jgi:transcription antitermination factor NusG
MALLKNRGAGLALLALYSLTAFGQVPEKLVGAVSAVALDKATLDVTGQDGKPVTVHLTSETVMQRVAPGERSLKNAETIQPTDIAVGDKVLVNSDPASGMARRVVLMSAKEISKHDEAAQAEWTTHGISGIVVSKTAEDITLRKGEAQMHVAVSKDTGFRKYAQDSVRFNDAKASNLADVNPGDQLRARGEKSEDGLKVTAKEIVFGTFVTKAGTITAIDTEHRTVAIKELNTNKPLTVKLTADSQLKQMPDFAGMGGGPPGGGAAAGGPTGGPPGAGGGMRRTPDVAQMVDHMPSVKLDALKMGDTIVMSSTKGAVENEFTAIVLLDNAGMLIRMATAQQGAGGATGRNQNAGGGGAQGMGAGGGMSGGMGSLELPSIMQ